jgi:hypothetical protein
MERCPEAEAVLDEMYTAFENGDAATFEKHLAKDPGLLVIGTDPNEWWEGDDVMRAMTAQLAELKAAGVGVDRGEKKSGREGNVAWVADRSAFRLSDGTTIPLRVTGTFIEQDGAWKLVQWHGSVGAANEETVGMELTT